MPNGGEYYYFDSSTKKLERSNNDIEKPGNKDAIGATLASLYDSKKSDDDAYGMWNDQPSKEHGAGAIYAHSKGVFHTDEKQGFYLIHSMPSFPTTHDEKYQQLPGGKFGQTFMCMTLKTSEFDKLGEDLQTMHAYFFDSKFGIDSIPAMKDASEKVENKEEQAKETVYTTVGGEKFTHFSKGRYWGRQLYEDLVAEKLGADLITETWQNGASKNVVPTFCEGNDYNHTIVNVMGLKLGDDEWKETQDHSKWAITSKGFDRDGSKGAMACIGGINRQFSQSKRGGATMCIENFDLNSELFDAITSYEDCNGDEVKA